MRDVRERVTDKSKARREPVRRLYVADVTSWVESVLDLSRHVEIDLAQHAVDEVFDTNSSELVVSRSETRSSRSKAWSKTRVFDQAFVLLD